MAGFEAAESLVARVAAAAPGPCPVCGAELRIGPGDRCAACGATLVLRVGISTPVWWDWFVAGLLGLAAGLGLVVGGWAARTWGSGLARAVAHHPGSALLAAALVASIIAWTRARDRIGARPHRVRLLRAAACAAWGVLMGVAHLAFVIWSRA